MLSLACASFAVQFIGLLMGISIFFTKVNATCKYCKLWASLALAVEHRDVKLSSIALADILLNSIGFILVLIFNSQASIGRARDRKAKAAVC